MYVIVVYDVGEKRVGKMLKLCRQYLCWIQNSVFEGELSEAKLRELKLKIKGIIDQSEDSIIIFTNNNSSLKFEITAKRLCAASQRVL